MAITHFASFRPSGTQICRFAFWQILVRTHFNRARRDTVVTELVDVVALAKEKSPDAARQKLDGLRLSYGIASKTSLEKHDKLSLLEDLILCALDLRLFTVAAKLYLDSIENIRLPLKERLADSLVTFEPSLFPLHLRLLGDLVKVRRLTLNSFQKEKLIESAFLHFGANGSPQNVDAAYRIASRAGADPILLPTFYKLIDYATKLNSGLLVNIWLQLKKDYSGKLTQLEPALQSFLFVFSRLRRYHPFAKEAIAICLPLMKDNPTLALAAIKACIKLNDRELVAALTANLPADPPTELLPSLVVLYFSVDQKRMRECMASLELAKTGFTGPEFGELIRVVAKKSTEQAEALCIHELAQERKSANMAYAYSALCTQAIYNNDFSLFQSTLEKLNSLASVKPGIALNLRLNWEYRRGSFQAAKLAYQRESEAEIGLEQRLIGLHTLADMIVKSGEGESSVEWLLSEYARIGVPPSEALNRLDRGRAQRSKGHLQTFTSIM